MALGHTQLVEVPNRLRPGIYYPLYIALAISYSRT
jgi:hypothetical protein